MHPFWRKAQTTPQKKISLSAAGLEMTGIGHLRIITGSAEALPILCVSDFCERERERERERDACDVIRYQAEIASDHAYDYLDGASTQRVDAF